MGLLSAMNKSVGGLNAQSFALENISGNIANSQTTAFKRTDTSFEDLVQSGTNLVTQMSAGNVRANGRSTVSLEGSIEGNANKTFMAVKGAGYFTVRSKEGEVDGATVFGTGQSYTRRGDFQIDKEGYLVNGAGYYLAGLSIDQTTNNPVGDTPQVMQIDKDPIPAEATTEIIYKLNLPESPKTNNYTELGTEASRLFDNAALTTAGEVNATEETDFLNSSISGGAVTTYDANGTAVNVQIRWAKTDHASAGPPAVEDTWQAYYLADASATTTDPKWLQVSDNGTAQDFTFDAAGAMTSPTTSAITLQNLTVNGSNLGDVTMNFGTGGLTQPARENGKAEINQLTQDGVPAGAFVDVSIADGGRVVANYSNGKTIDQYQIPLVTFSGESALRPMDGGAYAETKDSGPPVNNAAGLVRGSSLESSNVDISEEFTKLIVTQQAFSANSKVISTADQMMSEVLNIIR